MLKIALLSIALTTVALAAAPTASAECVPLLDPDFCTNPADPVVDEVKDTVQRLQDMECWYYPATHQIRCEF